jgi:PD-(D/E)XK endonuclease
MGTGFVLDWIMAVADDGQQDRDDKRNKKATKKFPPKRVGEIGELEFIQTAIRKGFRVSKPWGESDHYDAITDWKGKLLRVQVKATEHTSKDRGYMVHACVYVGNESIGLTKKDIDVLAAYISPEDSWYIIPVEHFVPLKSLWFNPGSTKSKFEKFREAWHWLKRKKKPKSRVGPAR